MIRSVSANCSVLNKFATICILQHPTIPNSAGSCSVAMKMAWWTIYEVLDKCAFRLNVDRCVICQAPGAYSSLCTAASGSPCLTGLLIVPNPKFCSPAGCILCQNNDGCTEPYILLPYAVYDTTRVGKCRHLL
jgi:hypothetical protein